MENKITQLNQKIIYSFPQSQEIIVISKVNDYVSFYTVVITLYKNHNNKTNSRYSAEMLLTLSKNTTIINDIEANPKHCGYGTKLFFGLIKFILYINDYYPITKITGFLAFNDYEHWDTLINFYSKCANISNELFLIFHIDETALRKNSVKYICDVKFCYDVL